MNLEEKLYTSTEVAEILGVSLRSVYRYLEEDKLIAEVKTATGRHRFTKQNILDFLYPNGAKKETSAEAFQEKVKVKAERTKTSEAFAPKTVPDVKEMGFVSEAKPVKTEPTKEARETRETEIDWLAKFREAAGKFKAEASETPETSSVVLEQPKETLSGLQDFPFGSVGTGETEEQDISAKKHYYRSAIGGLKEIAQNIDKSAKKASVDYAFTLNAGLSLHKPIKPFSVLHVYVRSIDKDLFEKMLHLTPSDEESAQLCLLISNRSSIYQDKKELHGLYVVSDFQLKNDLLEVGEEDLASEIDHISTF